MSNRDSLLQEKERLSNELAKIRADMRAFSYCRPVLSRFFVPNSSLQELHNREESILQKLSAINHELYCSKYSETHF